MTKHYDALIIGAGHNGLVCAFYLARAGLKVRIVEARDVVGGAAVTYQIVGDDEADIKLGKISISSPIARSLIGKYAGDVAEVQAPGGVREYEIIDVRYV